MSKKGVKALCKCNKTLLENIIEYLKITYNDPKFYLTQIGGIFVIEFIIFCVYLIIFVVCNSSISKENFIALPCPDLMPYNDYIDLYNHT